jgi:hydrogenase/urease accessory protein HupE
MADLSPAAQAVVNAYLNTVCVNPLGSIAAALRAVAHEVAPFPGRYPMNEYMEGFRDAKQSVHLQLIAIADELEQ